MARFLVNPLSNSNARALISPLHAEGMVTSVVGRTMVTKSHGPWLPAWNEVRNSFLALHLAMKLFQSAWLPLTKSHDYCGLDNRWVWLSHVSVLYVTGWLQCACLKLVIKYVSTMSLFRGEGPWNKATTSSDHNYGGIRTQKQLWASGAPWGLQRSGIYRTSF